MQFIGIAGQDDAAAIADFVEDFGLGGFEHIADTRSEIWEAFGVNAQPAYVFINDDGTIARQIGAMEDEVFQDALQQLTADNG